MKLTHSLLGISLITATILTGVAIAQNVRPKTSTETMTMTNSKFQPGANPLTFQSEGEKMSGILYLPKSYKSGDKIPTVIVTGAWMTIKEQMPSLYAQKLADQGYAAFVFDFRFWGESGGRLRNWESPQNKIIDIKNAVTFLQTVPAVDRNKIAGLGICASAGYMTEAVAQDDRIKSLITVAPWLHNPEIVNAVYGGKESVQKLVEKGKSAKEKFKSTGEVVSVLATSKTDNTAVMFGDIDYYQNPQRGAIPKWTNRFAIASWAEWLTFNPLPSATQIKVPTLFIHSEKAAIPDGAKQFFAAIPATKKEFMWLEGRSQFDFYDQTETVTPAIASIRKHLNASFGG